MKPTVKPEGLLEHIGLWANVGPVPAAEAMFGMGAARVIMAGVRLGLFAEIATEARAADEVAKRLSLRPEAAAHILDCLAALGHVTKAAGRYRLSARQRRWLDPSSPQYCGAFLDFNYDQWEWWSGLEDVARSGVGYSIHGFEPDDPRWRRYILAMFQLARLSAPEVARALRLPPGPKRLLDLAGGHGWFAAEVCKRHPGLSAVVLDLPGSVKMGREILAEHGLAGRVTHVEGDMLSADLGGPYDAVLCFQIIHHQTPEQNVALFRRVREALATGGSVAVLDYFAPPPNRKPDSSAFLGLHFYLTSASATYSLDDLRTWLAAAGFGAMRRVKLQRVPLQTLVQANTV